MQVHLSLQHHHVGGSGMKGGGLCTKKDVRAIQKVVFVILACIVAVASLFLNYHLQLCSDPYHGLIRCGHKTIGQKNWCATMMGPMHMRLNLPNNKRQDRKGGHEYALTKWECHS